MSMAAVEPTRARYRIVLSAAAPCSYGAFEETIGIDPNTPGALDVLDHAARAGYAGIDLGPVGYLGTGRELTRRLSERDIALAGGYLELAFEEPAALEQQLTSLHALLDVFEETRRGALPPRPTLAGCGTAAARLGPAAPRMTRTAGDWRRYADGVARAVDVCRRRGFEPTFHHHLGTRVETPAQVDELLSLSDIGLCLDTGHLAVAGGDPVDALRRWGDRINHIHMKDAIVPRFERLVDERAAVDELWRGEVFVALGDGELKCDEFLAQLREIGYSGWIVVEQDVFPGIGDAARRAAADQRRSRDFLRQQGY
jgi:inosose dehydratase